MTIFTSEFGAINQNLPFPCGICNKNVNKNTKAVFCDQCNKWIHIKCNNTSDSEYKALVEEPIEKRWICLHCVILNNSLIFPFTLEYDTVFLGLNDIAMPSTTDSLPSFEILSRLTNLPNLSDYDTDENLNHNITSQYATVQEVASMELSEKDFSLFLMNIRSQSLHFDELHALMIFEITGSTDIGL